jgi:DNA-binding transcriptional LysR family regulator
MSVPKINIYHLIVYYYVARAKNVSAAAEELYISQPAITRYIKSLEKSTKLKLFHVVKQRIVLTPAGETIYQYAKEFYQQIVHVERFIEIARESSLGVGISPILRPAISPIIEKLMLRSSSRPDLKGRNKSKSL